MSKKVKALALGDIIGQPGCRAIFIGLQSLIKDVKADFVIVNGENAANGFGITPEIANQLFTQGADVITSGNHIWQKDEILDYMNRNHCLLRPANYPKSTDGVGFVIVEKKGIKFGVVNLIGRHRLAVVDCPFSVGRKVLNELKNRCDVIIIDFHAELVEEKEALAYYLDGNCSLLFGTHTHTQTADERILPKGTGYISDLGMTGPMNSVIGSIPELSIRRMQTQLPIRSRVSDNDSVINGILVEIDIETRKALSIERINRKV